MGKFPGLTIASLKQHPAIIPIWGVFIAGGFAASYYTFRLAVYNPDVKWSKSAGTHAEANERYRNKQYKFKDTYDYSKGNPAPDYQNLEE